MAIGLAGTGLFEPVSLSWNLSLGLVGFASGFYVVPLNAWLQNIAEEAHRARVISALNLLTSFSAIVAISLGFLLKRAGLTASHQMLLWVPFLLVVSFLLPRALKSRPVSE